MSIFPLLIFPFFPFFPFFHFHPVFLLVSLFLYFLPAFLARNKPNFTAILLLNLFAGWTFIGWIIALVWALSGQSQGQAAAPAQPVAGSAPQPQAKASFFCSTCGKPCVAGASFCSSCGAALPSTQR
jgi:Superinfection immunity protein/zinc-ribbon domain